MERIVLVCRKPKDHEHTIALMETFFPECAVDIVAEPGEEPHSKSDSFENMASSFQIAPFLGSL